MIRIVTSLCFVFTSIALAETPPSCTSIDGLSSILKPGTVAVFGEIHGTVESPAFVEAVMCHAAARGLPILLGVEQDHAAESATNLFVASGGSDADRRSLLAQPFWSDVKQDGRASVAMFGLIDRARQLVRSRRAHIHVVAFSETTQSGQERDRLMADHISRAAVSAPNAVTIVLTGNLHSKMAVGVPFDLSYEPMGLLIRQRLTGRPVFGFDVSYPGGSAWMCGMNPPGCGPHALHGTAAQPPNQLVVFPAINADGYFGFYGVGALTPAEPTVRH